MDPEADGIRNEFRGRRPFGHQRPHDPVRERALALQPFNERRDGTAELSCVQDERHEPETRTADGRVDRKTPHERVSGQALQERGRQATAARHVPRDEATEFAEADGALDFGHARVRADRVKGLWLRTDDPAVVAQRLDLPEHIRPAGDDHAALSAGRDVLGMAEREAPDVAKRTDGPSPVFAAEALGAVLDDEDPPFPRKREKRTHVRDLSVQVDDDHRLRPRRQDLRDRLRVEKMVLADIREHHLRADAGGAGGGRAEGIGRHDHLVPRTDAARLKRQLERDRAVRDRQCAAHAEELRKGVLEGASVPARPVVDPPGAEDLEDGPVGLAVERGPTERRKRVHFTFRNGGGGRS